MAHVPGHEDPGSTYADLFNAPPPGAAEPTAEVIGGFYGGTTSGQPFLDPDGNPTGPLALAPGSTGATYYVGQEFDVLRGMTTEDRVRLQQQLVAVGLATEPLFGEIDDPTLKGMRTLMGLGNRSGQSWQVTLGRLATAETPEDTERAFQPEPYLAPDYATLAQEVKAQMEDLLGREPDASEIASLTSELAGYDRASFGVSTRIGRAQFEGAQEAAEGVEPALVTGRNVDPVARLRELMETKYRPEIDRIEQVEDNQVGRALLMGSIGNIDEEIGG